MPKTLLCLTLILAAAAAGCCGTSAVGKEIRLSQSDERIREELPVKQDSAFEPLCDSGGQDDSVLLKAGPETVYTLLPVFGQLDLSGADRDKDPIDRHPAIHGPYSLLLVGDFIAPGKDKLDEAYGLDSRFLIRVVDNVFMGGSIGYARMSNDDSKGLIEGELQRYTALFWTEYRLSLGDTAWSPSVDFGIGPGWFVAQPVPLSQREAEIETSDRRLDVGVISTTILRIVAQFRLPVLRSTDISISEGNADLIIGIGGDWGKGTGRYSITDFAAGVKTKSRGDVILDAFHAFAGLSFRF